MKAIFKLEMKKKKVGPMSCYKGKSMERCLSCDGVIPLGSEYYAVFLGGWTVTCKDCYASLTTISVTTLGGH